MNIVEPKAELWCQVNINDHITRCAQVCYRSDREVDSDEFIKARLRAGHKSILRHGTKYYKIPIPKNTYSNEYMVFMEISDMIDKLHYADHVRDNNYMYVAVNMQQYYEASEVFEELEKYEIDEIEAYNIQILHEYIFRYTFYIQTQISTTRELNRVSPNNILEESTRYVEEGTLCRPWWCDNSFINEHPALKKVRKEYFNSCEAAFEDYNFLIKNGLEKQDARGVLPLDTCTHVVYTYTIQEWRDIIDKRYYGKTGKPHPNCVEVIEKVKEILESEGYEFATQTN